MNLTKIKVYPSGELDMYDQASRDLHEAILTGQSIERIKELQDEVLHHRNMIAEALHRDSWAGIPAENRY